MKFLKNILPLTVLLFVLSMITAGNASATVSGSTVMGVAQGKAIQLFESVKTIVFVVGGFGLIALAFAAIFGKVKWSWFAGLAFGLAILAAAGSIVEYATGDDDFKTGEGASWNDTFGSAGSGL